MKKLLFCMAMAACAAHAAKVSSVTVKMADGGEDTGDVLARCMVKAGDEYDPQQCTRDVRTLRDTNAFEDISVKAEQSANGVAVTYIVTRKKRFQGPLNVTGNDFWGVGKIASLSELRDGYPYGEAEIAAAAGRIRTAYQKKFFSEVRVTPRVEPVEGSPNAVRITMEIVEGPRVKSCASHSSSIPGGTRSAGSSTRPPPRRISRRRATRSPATTATSATSTSPSRCPRRSPSRASPTWSTASSPSWKARATRWARSPSPA